MFENKIDQFPALEKRRADLVAFAGADLARAVVCFSGARAAAGAACRALEGVVVEATTARVAPSDSLAAGMAPVRSSMGLP